MFINPIIAPAPKTTVHAKTHAHLCTSTWSLTLVWSPLFSPKVRCLAPLSHNFRWTVEIYMRLVDISLEVITLGWGWRFVPRLVGQ